MYDLLGGEKKKPPAVFFVFFFPPLPLLQRLLKGPGNDFTMFY